MKKISTLALALTFTLMAMADRPSGKITIANEGIRKIVVELDGQPFRQADQLYDFDNMFPGLHDVRIYEVKQNSGWLQLLGLPKSKRLVYNKQVMVKANMELSITVNRAGRIVTREEQLWRKPGRGNGHYGDKNRHDDNDRYNNRAPFYQAMDNRDFDRLMNTLRRESFDQSRLAIARQATSDKYFSTRQVMDMVLLFSFDDKKLDMAKALYGHTVDKENFYEVYNAFSFSRSKEELANYIRNYR